MTVYAGKLLRIDLTTPSHTVQTIAEDDVRKWLLGSGLAAKIYYEEMDPSLHPLDPASPLIVMNGLLTGSMVPTACRTSWCGRSPETHIWNESNVGHHWGAELRAAGYDGIIITGRAAHPMYIWIDGRSGEVHFCDASHLWGKDWFEAGEALLNETDRQAQIAGIGIAGENLVTIAGVMVGPPHYVRAAARGGMGALMGSKSLKAIVVRGDQRPTYPDPQRLREEVKRQTQFLKESLLPMTMMGTAGGVMVSEEYGDFPIRNWTLGNWPEVKNLAGQTFYPKYLQKRTHCFACPIGCGKEIEIQEGPYRVPRGEGVEYETIAGFGGMCYVSSFEAVALANSLCNRYGLDTISTSAVIAFGMELFERGILSLEDTGGIELRFGNADAMLDMIHQIAHRQGLGAILAGGVREAARRIGKGAEQYAIHVKGLEVAYHDPRAFFSMAVNYATGVRGACHLEAATYWNGYGVKHPDLGYSAPVPRHESGEANVKLCYDYQNYAGVFNPLGLCKFMIKGSLGPERLTALVNAALGWDWSTQDVLETGDRLFQLKRLINVRLGVTAKDDRLPARFTQEPRPTGTSAGALPDMSVMLPLYYSLRGWDSEGRPTQERLRRLGIPYVEELS